MFSVYVLKSLKNGKRYVGYTSKRAVERLIEHNNGCNIFTKHNGSFLILHTGRYESKTDAIRRELFLKSGRGRKYLDSFLK